MNKLIAIYAAMFLVTFGKSYVEQPKTRTAHGVEFAVSPDYMVITSFAASAFWPMYWSIEAWEEIEK